ncbi:MAG: hypothetical protein GY725_17910 [bacterium]|nr:hypothetical protein [bacterium]
MRSIRIAVVLVAGMSLLVACSDDGPAKTGKVGKIYKPKAGKKMDEGNVVEAAYRYDPTDKPDPFRSWIRQERKLEDGATSPLERFDLSQLEITGIIWSMKMPRALIKDPTGKGYVVNEGTPVGKNKGRIVLIEDNRVVVKETYVDFQDRATSKEVEMKLYGKNGG